MYGIRDYGGSDVEASEGTPDAGLEMGTRPIAQEDGAGALRRLWCVPPLVELHLKAADSQRRAPMSSAFFAMRAHLVVERGQEGPRVQVLTIMMSSLKTNDIPFVMVRSYRGVMFLIFKLQSRKKSAAGAPVLRASTAAQQGHGQHVQRICGSPPDADHT
jgi:hypothetical protein